MAKKTNSKHFTFDDETVFYLQKIAELEKRTMTNVIEFSLKEKAHFYGIKYLKPQKMTGAYKHLKK